MGSREATRWVTPSATQKVVLLEGLTEVVPEMAFLLGSPSFLWHVFCRITFGGQLLAVVEGLYCKQVELPLCWPLLVSH